MSAIQHAIVAESYAADGGARIRMSTTRNCNFRVYEIAVDGTEKAWSAYFPSRSRFIVPTKLDRRRNVRYVSVTDLGPKD